MGWHLSQSRSNYRNSEYNAANIKLINFAAVEENLPFFGRHLSRQEQKKILALCEKWGFSQRRNMTTDTLLKRNWTSRIKWLAFMSASKWSINI